MKLCSLACRSPPAVHPVPNRVGDPCFTGKLSMSILKHFDYKLLGRNVQLIKILNVSRHENSQYVFLGQKKVQRALGISQVCVSQALRIPSHRRTLYWISGLIP